MNTYNGFIRRLLIVEDNPGDAAMICDLLDGPEAPQRSLESVPTLADAAAALDRQNADVVLLDLRLPDGEGVDCVKFIRAHAPDLPIVVLTGSDDDDAMPCIEAGAQDYLSKNEVSQRSLRRAVSYAVARSRESIARRLADDLSQRLAAIVEGSSDAIVSATLDGVITSWNRGAERIFGYKREEAVGRPFGDVLRAADADEARRQRDRLARARESVDDLTPQDVVRLRKDGGEVVLSVMTAHLRDAAGHVVEIAAICRDVTEERRRERELQRRNEELIERDEQMRALTSRLNEIREEERTRISREVHDELGQLLTGVKMDLRWVARRYAAGTPPAADAVVARLAEAEKLVDRTVQSVQRLALELRPSVLDALGLPEAVRDEARRFEVRSGVATEVQVRGNPRPSAEVSTVLFRVFQELLTNVARHARATRIWVTLVEDGGEVNLRVEDDGVGVGTAPLRGSTSLGLLGIRERVASQNGTFQIGRRDGGGTLASARVRTSTKPSLGWPMKHVLIADDHEIVRRGLLEILRENFASVEICEAGDFTSALRLLPTRPWDLLLLDILMPGGNVLDLLAHVRSADANVPVLVLTAATETEYVIQTLKAGANGFVHKHRTSDELLEAIRKVSSGGRYLDPDSALAVAAALGSERPAAHEKLSARELEIFRLIALGRAVKEVAADLGLSDKTVATYLARIREKTGLSSHVEIARYALRHRLVD